MHAICLLWQGLCWMPRELNHFIVRSQRSCRRITLPDTSRERTDTHREVLLLLSLWSTPGNFGERLLPLGSSPLPPKANPAPRWVRYLFAFPHKPIRVFPVFDGETKIHPKIGWISTAWLEIPKMLRSPVLLSTDSRYKAAGLIATSNPLYLDG